MYCHGVITVKTEYSISKFVSAERSMANACCRIQFIRVGSKHVLSNIGPSNVFPACQVVVTCTCNFHPTVPDV